MLRPGPITQQTQVSIHTTHRVIKRSNDGGQTHPLPQLPQYPHLHKRLLMKPLLIPYNLHRHHPALLMVHTPHHLPKTPLPQQIHHLIPIRQMVAHHDIVIAPLIIIPIVSGLRVLLGTRVPSTRKRADNLLRVLGPGEVNAILAVIHDLAPLEDIQPDMPIHQNPFGTNRRPRHRTQFQRLRLLCRGIDITPFLREPAHLVVGG